MDDSLKNAGLALGAAFLGVAGVSAVAVNKFNFDTPTVASSSKDMRDFGLATLAGLAVAAFGVHKHCMPLMVLGGAAAFVGGGFTVGAYSDYKKATGAA